MGDDQSIRGVFISYRRDDSGAWAGRLYDNLARHFGEPRVFMDVENIAPGEDFHDAISATLAGCDVLLAVIGPGWLDARNEAGARRLDDEGDFVRDEISHALTTGNRVIPVLVGGATMPRASELPEVLLPLANRQGFELSANRFLRDVDLLVEALERTPTRPTGPVAATAAASAGAVADDVAADVADAGEVAADPVEPSEPPQPPEPPAADGTDDQVAHAVDPAPVDDRGSGEDAAGVAAVPPLAAPQASTVSADPVGRSGSWRQDKRVLGVVALVVSVLAVGSAVYFWPDGDEPPDTEETAASSAPETSAAPTTAAAPTTTRPSETSSTAAATTVAPVVASAPDTTVFVEVTLPPVGDLGLAEPIRNIPCDDRYIVVFHISVPDAAAVQIGTMLDEVAALPEGVDPSYTLNRESCSALEAQYAGQDIYAAYLGPVDTVDEVCELESIADAFLVQFREDDVVPFFIGDNAYVRRMRDGIEPGQDVPCSAF